MWKTTGCCSLVEWYAGAQWTALGKCRGQHKASTKGMRNLIQLPISLTSPRAGQWGTHICFGCKNRMAVLVVGWYVVSELIGLCWTVKYDALRQWLTVSLKTIKEFLFSCLALLQILLWHRNSPSGRETWEQLEWYAEGSIGSPWAMAANTRWRSNHVCPALQYHQQFNWSDYLYLATTNAKSNTSNDYSEIDMAQH